MDRFPWLMKVIRKGNLPVIDGLQAGTHDLRSKDNRQRPSEMTLLSASADSKRQSMSRQPAVMFSIGLFRMNMILRRSLAGAHVMDRRNEGS